MPLKGRTITRKALLLEEIKLKTNTSQQTLKVIIH
jgi:hypothetical protein